MNWNPVIWHWPRVLLELAVEQGRVEVTVSEAELVRRWVAKGYNPWTGWPLH